MSKAWKATKGDGPNGERRVSERIDGKAFVTFLQIGYAGYCAGKREGGYASESQAQSWCNRRLRKLEGAQS